MSCNVMDYLLLTVIIPVIVVMFGNQVICSISCVPVCGEGRSNVSCSQALILVSDVTNQKLERNSVAFENTKRDCMGKDSCDLSRVCSKETGEPLILHYLCVNASDILSKKCSQSVERVKGEFGYLQNPAYPASATSSYASCKWEIQSPRDSAVFISLHDIVLGNSKGSCGDSIIVSGHSCDRRNPVLHFLCEGGNLTNFIVCGKVVIELHAPYRPQSMRFWLSFHVRRREHNSTLQDTLHCSHRILGMDDISSSSKTDTTTSPTANNSDSNTEVLIIMLSIISGISAVLLIILIVVCIRCRLLQASRSEPVYSDPSPSVPAHIEYISSLGPEKPCPRLADGYFEVADALPFTQRVGTPTSPAYAEVENFAHPRKALKPSSSEECLNRSKSLNEDIKKSDTDLNNSSERHTDNYAVSSDIFRHKRGVLARLKGERGKLHDKDRLSSESRNSTGPKIILISVKKDASLGSSLATPHPGLQTQIYSEDESGPTYEPIEKYCPNKLSSDHDKKTPVAAGQPITKSFSTDSSVGAKSQTSLDRKRNSSSQLFAHWSDTLDSETRNAKKPAPFSKAVTSNLNEGSKTLPSRKPKSCLHTSMVKNNDFRYNACKDMPRASGIVKNGIRRFEQNSS